MTATDAPVWDEFAAALAADGPHPDHTTELMTFGQFVGSWAMEVRFFDPSGAPTSEGEATWTFAWVLDGRAIQDVLVFGLADGTPTGRGTTLRYFDPKAGRWHVYWLGSLTGTIIRLEAQPSTGDIILEGTDVNASLQRWTFSDITPEGFLWRGVASDDGGRSWYLEQEMVARRRVDFG